jgi:hypothetical protein
MNNFSTKLLAGIGLFLLCGLATGLATGANRLTGISGCVSGSTNEIRTVSICTFRGAPVTTVETDQRGYFKIDLAPGKYVLTPFYAPAPTPGKPTPEYILRGKSVSVAVLPNHFTSVFFPFIGALDLTDEASAAED